MTHSHNKADYIGILGSVLCIIHCIAVPALAMGTAFTDNHHTYIGFISLDYIFILINGIAVYFATKDHKSILLKMLLWGALLIFAVSLIFEGRHYIFHWLGYIGSILLIAGHFINLYICQIAPRIKLKIS
ncbi:MerC domain-containing protein [Dyadobacter sp. CY356]|uniref:MerC domain-containing protein n=1 Tax=Dyadobacter sp. CY356 TaxID=2906442 RepID=UPI001F45F9C3|nr:MerC domain-containing protein [Dyadobacter sp. CY356]MCF0058349.1 MerC domain-containing protein [Dyadobacter sp. CY356]